MPATTLSPASVAIGPQSWRNDTIQGIRQAEQLVRTVGAAKPNSGPRTCSAGAQFICRRGDRRQRVASTCQDETKDKITPLCAVRPSSALVPFFSTVSPPSLRERCVNIGTGEAVGYMRCVRSVEGLLRGQAGKVWLECRKLERDRGYLERMLRTLRKNLMVNRRSVEDRTLRPANAETGRDGADSLLDHEQRELTELKAQLEGTLRNTLTQLQALKHCSRTLLECANERSRVLDFLPRSGSHSAGSYRSPGKVPLKPSSAGPYTPECEQVMESSCAALSQSQLLRNQIRQMICESTARQNAAHQSVNEGLMRKITETVSLKQHLTVSSAATRHAINRKQRQLNSVEQSHGRALGPVSCRDLQSRERLDRPLVQLYQKHPANPLSEAMHLEQGIAVLQQNLSSLGGELAQLNAVHMRLMEDLQGKEAAAQVDSAVVRLRRCRRNDHH